MSEDENNERGVPGTPSNDLLTTSQVSEITGITVFSLEQYRTLRNKGLDKGPEFIKRDRYVFYRRAAVMDYLARRGG